MVDFYSNNAKIMIDEASACLGDPKKSNKHYCRWRRKIKGRKLFFEIYASGLASIYFKYKYKCYYYNNKIIVISSTNPKEIKEMCNQFKSFEKSWFKG